MVKSIEDLIQEHELRQLSLDHASYEWGYEEGFVDGLEEVLRIFKSSTVGANQEKIKAFEEIQIRLWDLARRGSPLQSTIAAALIRDLEIPSLDGEGAEGA